MLAFEGNTAHTSSTLIPVYSTLRKANIDESVLANAAVTCRKP
ncbi:hypothetical protein ACNKHS_11375 [Shigella flexneri]